MNAVAIIPARGGSKRLPRKNIADFLGRPIIAYTIGAALESRCFERVVVSTEDDEIAAIASGFGAAIDRRPSVLATDKATIVEVCLDFLDREAAARREWRVMTCLYATAPLRNAQDIRDTMALLEPGRCGFAMAVTTYDQDPRLALRLGWNGSLTPMWPEFLAHRTDELPPLRICDGSTLAVDVAEFRRYRTFYGAGLRAHDIPRSRSIDIDTQSDLDRAVWVARISGLDKKHDNR
jgi:pseudaminic acid cytidylyltransferase